MKLPSTENTKKVRNIIIEVELTMVSVYNIYLDNYTLLKLGHYLGFVSHTKQLSL